MNTFKEWISANVSRKNVVDNFLLLKAEIEKLGGYKQLKNFPKNKEELSNFKNKEVEQTNTRLSKILVALQGQEIEVLEPNNHD